MRHAILFATALSLAAAGTARADFVITGISSSPDFSTGQGANDAQSAQATAPSPEARWKMAYGFGNDVPLGFACRQIVPPAVKVTYGPGADPSMPVSWKGGDTWNHVLRDVVRPLGLHLVMTHMAVEIRR